MEKLIFGGNGTLQIQAFLSMKSKQVRLLQILSSSASCPSGVPQGSAIPPMLFNVYIDDSKDEIFSNLSVDTLKYVDKCTIHQAVRVEKTSHTQHAPNIIEKWSMWSKMFINVIICLTESVPESLPVDIVDELVKRVDKFKLPGLGLQNNLKWNNHVETKHAKQKANSQVYISSEPNKAGLPVEQRGYHVKLFKNLILGLSFNMPQLFGEVFQLIW